MQPFSLNSTFLEVLQQNLFLFLLGFWICRSWKTKRQCHLWHEIKVWSAPGLFVNWFEWDSALFLSSLLVGILKMSIESIFDQFWWPSHMRWKLTSLCVNLIVSIFSWTSCIVQMFAKKIAKDLFWGGIKSWFCWPNCPESKILVHHRINHRSRHLHNLILFFILNSLPT